MKISEFITIRYYWKKIGIIIHFTSCRMVNKKTNEFIATTFHIVILKLGYWLSQFTHLGAGKSIWINETEIIIEPEASHVNIITEYQIYSYVIGFLICGFTFFLSPSLWFLVIDLHYSLLYLNKMEPKIKTTFFLLISLRVSCVWL